MDSVIWVDDENEELTCKPLDTYNEILLFLQNPPSWRSLCKEIQPHSKRLIRNQDMKKDLRRDVSRVFQDGPETFCHIAPDAEEVERHDEKSLPKTLVCHDMANGYHDDSFIDGTGNYEAYTFYNWAGIDIFCYFSHHLITIPPLGWINVGHAHGVKVIGTVITEWADGMAFWDVILSSESEYKNFASALVAIAKTLKFDGWLLNIENKIVQPDVLMQFVQHLHTILHQELKDPVLIWYDSVTVDGHLNWQNALNHKNKAFFDVCDGFFTNYSWTEQDVESSATEAGDRINDLFIGIDVWGRNFYGGGQFNIQQAIDVANSHGCSIAIFAPAWTYEALTTDKSDVNVVAMSDNLHKYEQFMLRDRAVWDSIWSFLNTRLPCTLPFKTSFCRGQGKKRRLYGEVICPVPWYNLRHMQYQPNSSHGPHGYMLSTIEHIMHASRHGILRNTKGIIKYRDALNVSLSEMHTCKSSEENEEESRLIPKSDSISGLTEDTTEPENNSENKPKSLKRKLKNVFKHIFRVKSSKNDIEEEPGHVPKPSEEQMRLETCEEESNENKIDSKKDNREVAFQEPVNNVKQEQEKNDLDQQKAEINEDNNDSKKDNREVAFQEPVNNVKQEQEKNDLDQQKAEINEDNNDSKKDNREVAFQEPVNNVKQEQEKNDFDQQKAEINEDNKEEAVDEELCDDDDTEPRVLQKRSMVQMSINIKLKDTSQKTRYGLACVQDERPCLEVYFEDSFIGGSCLKINPSDPVSSQHRLIRIFHCDFFCEDSLIVCVVTKHLRGFEEQFLNIKFYMKAADNSDHRIVLIGRNLLHAQHPEESASCFVNLYPVMKSDAEFRDIQKYLLLNEPDVYVPVENSYDWIVRYYEIHLPGSRLTSINCDTGLAQGPILLGHLAICGRLRGPTTSN